MLIQFDSGWVKKVWFAAPGEYCIFKKRQKEKGTLVIYIFFGTKTLHCKKKNYNFGVKKRFEKGGGQNIWISELENTPVVFRYKY